MTSELPLNVMTKLKEATDTPQIEEQLPQQLPLPLAEFKQYVDSKWCYYSKPIENAEVISIQPKVAFQCQMTIFMETRKLRVEKTPHHWQTDTVLVVA